MENHDQLKTGQRMRWPQSLLSPNSRNANSTCVHTLDGKHHMEDGLLDSKQLNAIPNWDMKILSQNQGNIPPPLEQQLKGNLLEKALLGRAVQPTYTFFFPLESLVCNISCLPQSICELQEIRDPAWFHSPLALLPQ